MYEKDKRQRITLRLNEEQFNFVKKACEMLGITPSDYIRMLVNTMMFSADLVKPKTQGILQEALGRENDEANSDD